MKKTLTLTVMTLLAGAVTSYSQGTVSIVDAGSFAIQVFGVQPTADNNTIVSYNGFVVDEVQGDPSASENGNLSNPGSTVYGTHNPLGSGYTVQLLAAAGTDQPLSALLPVPAANGGIATAWFSTTGALDGMWNTTSVASIPGATGNATVAIAAWNNEGGTVNSLLAAQQAGDPWGISSLGTVALATGDVTPGLLPQNGNPNGFGNYVDGGIESFSLGQAIPEPSTIALGVIGASAFLFRRRK
jgi:hypothetical protein